MARHIHIEEEEECAHGGSWKIALADLMTVLMVFFLVMWLSAIMDPGDRKALADSFKDPKPTSDSSGGVQENSPMPELKGDVLINPIEELKPLTKEDIESWLKGLGAVVEETPDAFNITVRSDKAFESGRASLQEDAKAKLELLGERLVGRRQMITITGHTDNVPIRNVSFPSNWELSAARASSVARLFVEFEVTPKFITVSGRGDVEPLSDNDNNLGRAQNRRVVIKIDKKEVPADEPKGKKAKPAKATAKP